MNSYRSTSAWTGRASRTCQEAFGPYTSFDLNEPRRRTAKWPWIVWAVLMVALAIVLATVQVTA